MKKILLFGSVALFAIATIFTSCDDKDEVQTASVEEVSVSSLETSGAKTSVKSDSDAQTLINALSSDTTVFTALNDYYTKLTSSDDSSNEETSASTSLRSTTTSSLLEEIKTQLNNAQSSFNSISETGSGTINFSLSQIGEITDLPNGLSATINKANATVKISSSSEDSNLKITASADGDVDLKSSLNTSDFLTAQNVTVEEGYSPVIKSLAANFAATSGLTGTASVSALSSEDSSSETETSSEESSSTTPDLDLELTELSGTASSAFSFGASFCTSDNLGGKIIVNGKFALNGSLNEDNLAIFEKTDPSDSEIKSALDSLPVTCSLTANFYDDDGNKTYEYINVSSLSELYEKLNALSDSINSSGSEN